MLRFCSFVCPLLASSSVDIPTREIAPGVNMPVVSIGTGGTSKWKDGNVDMILKAWLGLGGKGIDTAWIYGTEDQVSKTLGELGSNRSELFILSKIPGCADAKNFVEKNLKALGTDYIDLLLIHSHVGLNCQATWKELEDLQQQGILRSIGVSNWVKKDLEKLMEVATVTPAVNQIHLNVLNHDDDTIAYCQANGIIPMAYSPLQDGVTQDPTIQSVASSHNVSTYQVALKWITQHDMLVTFQSTTAAHQEEDVDIFDFELTTDEIAALDGVQASRAALV